MNKIILAVITLVTISFAQDRTLPLSNSDNGMFFNLTGNSPVLLSTDKLLKKIDVTYTSTDRNVQRTKYAIQLCSIDAKVSSDAPVISSVIVFTDRFGLARVTVKYSDGNTQTKTLNEILRRKAELQQE